MGEQAPEVFYRIDADDGVFYLAAFNLTKQAKEITISSNHPSLRAVLRPEVTLLELWSGAAVSCSEDGFIRVALAPEESIMLRGKLFE